MDPKSPRVKDTNAQDPKIKDPKIKEWIDAGKDPRTAHWQGGLEAILDVFMPYLEPGRLIPVQPLEEPEMAVFLAALEVVNLSPNLIAAFFPPAIAEKIVPPESADTLVRIAAGKPSYKILIARPGDDHRILCGEISAYAERPGVDIFQSGALLGTYDFQNQKDCMAQLNKIIRFHVWEKGKWSEADCRRYTVNWFEKVVDLRKKTVCVENDFSYFHSPTLIRSNKTDVVFTLIFEMIQKRLGDPDDPLKEAVLAVRATENAALQKVQLSDLADKIIFELLAVMKECDLIPFDKMTDSEAEKFNRESAGTIQRIVKYMEKM